MTTRELERERLAAHARGAAARDARFERRRCCRRGTLAECAEDLALGRDEHELVELEGTAELRDTQADGEPARFEVARPQPHEGAVDHRIMLADRLDQPGHGRRRGRELLGEQFFCVGELARETGFFGAAPGFTHRKPGKRGREQRDRRDREQEPLSERHAGTIPRMRTRGRLAWERCGRRSWPAKT